MLYKNYQKTILLFNVLLLSTSLYASSPEKEESSRLSSSSSSSNATPSSSRKRSSDNLGELPCSPSKRQVFARTTYDATSKYVLGHPEVRLDFIKNFSGIKNIEKTELLSGSLNPLHGLTNLRELLTNKSTKNFMNAIKAQPDKFIVVEKDPLAGKDIERQIGSAFIRQLSKNFNELVEAFPNQQRASQLDIVCQLSNKDYALVEIQVLKENCWDQRALAYLAGIYSRQLTSGDKWENIKKVIGINILGGGAKNVSYWSDKRASNTSAHPIRRYRFQDEHNALNIIPHMELYQYSLGDADLDSDVFKDNTDLKNWLDFFKDAHNKNEVPQDISLALQQAYELVRYQRLPENVRTGYLAEERIMHNFTEHETIVREEAEKRGLEKGRAEGIVEGEKKGRIEGITEGEYEKAVSIAKKMLNKQKSIEEIIELTELTQTEIEQIQASF